MPPRCDGLAVVIPCFNAGTRVRPVAAAALEVADRVIVVDDGSTDGCIDALRPLDLRIVQFPENRGKGHALIEGFRTALAVDSVTCACVVDADGQHDPAEIPRLHSAFVERRADLVIGSRIFDGPGVPWRSRYGNKLTIGLTALLLGQKVPDTQSGFRLHSRRFLEDVVQSVRPGRYETEMEILVKGVREGYAVVPAPIKTIYEVGNPSSHFNKFRDSVRIYLRLFRTALRTRKTPPQPRRNA